MTRDEIIEAMDWHAPSTETGPDSLLARVERVIARAVVEEREACAKVCDELGERIHGPGRDDSEAFDCADAIRARGEK